MWPARQGPLDYIEQKSRHGLDCGGTQTQHPQPRYWGSSRPADYHSYLTSVAEEPQSYDMAYGTADIVGIVYFQQ